MKKLFLIIFLSLFVIGCDGSVAPPPPSPPISIIGEWVGTSLLVNANSDCSGEWTEGEFGVDIACTGVIFTDSIAMESCEGTNQGEWEDLAPGSYSLNHLVYGSIPFYTTDLDELIMTIIWESPYDNNTYCIQETFSQGILNCQECNPSSCSSGIFDCHGVCDGSAVEDCVGECGGVAEIDCAGVCNGDAIEDCTGECGGVAETDCAGVCNGDATEDVCGVCEGSQTNTSECIGNGKYAVTEVRYYSSNNCSGSPIETLYGPTFYFDSANYSYYDDECNYENAIGGETITLTLDFDGDEYAVIRTEDEDELDQMCYDYDGSCANSAECYQCGSYDEDTYEIAIEAGTFNKQNSTLTFAPNVGFQYAYGTVVANYTYCGEPYSDIDVYDGCLWYYYWSGTYNMQYLEQGSRIILTSSQHEQSNDGDCPEGYVADCAGDGDCCPEHYIGDGYCDGGSECYGCNLTCYDNDGGDCLYYNEYCAGYDALHCIEYELNFISNFTLGGCTDETAASYNPYATYDDGSCDAGECYYLNNQDNVVKKRIPANKFDGLINSYPEKRRIVK